MQITETSTLPLTLVFVDYESWFWGLYNAGETPDVRQFLEEIKKVGRIEQIRFFGDFSREEINRERNKVRTITSEIVDCTNEETKKDFSDAVMLDQIYMTAHRRPDIEQYIIVTGDGHFNFVIASLRTHLNKTVGVYGVRGTMSSQLKESASWYKEFETTVVVDLYWEKILRNIRSAEQRGLIPSFSKTVDACSQYYRMDRAKVHAALIKLIEDGYIKQEVRDLPQKEPTEFLTNQAPFKIKALEPDWELIYERGLLPREGFTAA